MKISQVLFLVAIIAKNVTGSSVAKKLVNEEKDKKDGLRVTRSPSEIQTSYVLSQTFEPKVDAHQLLQQTEQLGGADTNAYGAALLTQSQQSLFTPSQTYDLSKLYNYKTVKQPYYAYVKVKPSSYKVEHPVSYVYGKPTSVSYASATPIAQSLTSYTANEDDRYRHSDSYASKYKFGYRVSDPHTGAEFGHSEVSEGHITRGHYHVLLPDGRIQNVKYWADPSGYHATVTYELQKFHYP